MAFLNPRTEEEHTRITGDYVPNGPHLRAKRLTGKTLYKLLKGLSKEFFRVEGALSSWVDGRLIHLDGATDFVEEWEAALGIPDGDFLAVGTDEERRRQVMSKLASEGVTTKEDLEWLCGLMGFAVTVTPGHYYYLNPDARVTFPSGDPEKESRFTIVFETDFDASIAEVTPVLFPVPWPWPFRGNNYNAMKNFLVSIIPANVNAQFIYPPPDSWGYGFFAYGISPFGK